MFIKEISHKFHYKEMPYMHKNPQPNYEFCPDYHHEQMLYCILIRLVFHLFWEDFSEFFNNTKRKTVYDGTTAIITNLQYDIILIRIISITDLVTLHRITVTDEKKCNGDKVSKVKQHSKIIGLVNSLTLGKKFYNTLQRFATRKNGRYITSLIASIQHKIAKKKKEKTKDFTLLRIMNTFSNLLHAVSRLGSLITLSVQKRTDANSTKNNCGNTRGSNEADKVTSWNKNFMDLETVESPYVNASSHGCTYNLQFLKYRTTCAPCGFSQSVHKNI
ncbi:hypothetical protein WN51_08485 [Melipona quadrifasciata]|uniref:Uncharacterized protein n=1 Tax=Melipona quadrifasciata TaxID=166423 RepID=A0A0M9A8P1_9HYME|nr:hypothetical protein WN51_08485 [Melipona quadrifasciata]